MVRLKDIAERAGVSTTTVSHVLNSSRYVHPATVERVLKAVKDLNYRPNMLARSLRQRQTHTIGLLVSDIENPYFAEMARSIETTAYERGYNVILCNTDESLAKEVLYVDVLFAKQVDGLILAPAPGDHSFLQAYLKDGAQVVFVNRYIPGIPAPAVISDNEDGMYTLVSHLLADGHRRLGVIVGLEAVTTTQSRLAGLRRALEDHGQKLDDVWYVCGGVRREGGYQAARDLAQMAEPPSAVIAFNIMTLEGVILGLLEKAPHLVGRIEITGFGYSPVACACRSCKYYVTQPSYELGRVAATMLLDALMKEAPLEARQVVLSSPLAGFDPDPSSGLGQATPSRNPSLYQ